MTGHFPEGFVWGAATAAFQIEGAANTDGRGVSIWDTFCRTPGKVFNGDTGDVACDHYHRYESDIALMTDLCLRAYRFSISWARVVPNGTGAVNPAGLDFYDRLVDTLLAKGIQPYATLYHWDMPQALQDRGGWVSREAPTAFAAYSEAVARRLGDRVKDWMTINEPWVISMMGYGTGDHAPGLHDWKAALQASHHVLLAHGEGMRAVRAAVPGARVGIVLNTTWVDPASEVAADKEAAARFDGFYTRWFADPVFTGAYPVDMMNWYGTQAPTIHEGDMASISAPTDFLGVNYYSRVIIGAGDHDSHLKVRYVRGAGEHTAMDWEVYPDGLYNSLKKYAAYQPKKIFVTENGAAYDDQPSGTGAVEDPQREAYLRHHLAAAARAIQDGVPLAGYFVWSLLDNFEWALGYSKRFGIVYVDYATQKRTPKRSALYYRDVIQRNAL
ncbi:MAG TPA: GH1 family beta-glucosidase [Aggregatilineales bacterium]|nr:beta-glucosidase [Anaerolineales bacterium]HRE46582.1 GH1 family beta-glucosidase [Aggregatilineales bacterium]